MIEIRKSMKLFAFFESVLQYNNVVNDKTQSIKKYSAFSFEILR